MALLNRNIETRLDRKAVIKLKVPQVSKDFYCLVRCNSPEDVVFSVQNNVQVIGFNCTLIASCFGKISLGTR